MEHLNKDVKCFSERFKNLNNKVDEFNTNLDNFQNIKDNRLSDLVKKYFEKNGFTISKNDLELHKKKENIVIITTLLLCCTIRKTVKSILHLGYIN